jgi:DNA helicase-2/ATP-dependent DNA helicase PcrA
MDPSYFAKKAGSSYEERMLNVYQEYQKSLEISNLMDFDDLLLYPYILFKKNPEVLTKRQNKFDYIMVDEAQDTNRIQFELIKMLS